MFYRQLLLGVLLLTGTFLAGCADAGGSADQVFTGTSNIPQSLLFEFERQARALPVPGETAQIRFKFFSGQSGLGTLLLEEARDFAPLISFDGVSPQIRSAVITMLNGDGDPILEGVVALSLSDRGDSPVSLNLAEFVAVEPLELTLPLTDFTIAVGEIRQLQAKLIFTNGDSRAAPEARWGAVGQAMVDADGLLTGLADGVSTVTATRDALMVSTDFIVGRGAPTSPTLTVSPDSELLVNQNVSTIAFDNLTLMDEQLSLAGGTLTLRADDSGVDDIALQLPSSPDIGIVTGSGGPLLTVALGDGATPEAIQESLRGATVESSTGLNTGEGTLSIQLDDGQGGFAEGSRTFLVIPENALSLFVDLEGTGDFDRIQDAIDHVSGSGAAGSVITVDGDDFSALEPTLEIRNDANLEGLRLRGGSFRRSAGVNPNADRAGSSIVASMTVDNANVDVDGFNFVSTGANCLSLTSNADGTVITNNLFLGPAPTDTGRGITFTTSRNAPTDVTISDNGFTGWDTATRLEGLQTNRVKRITISRNAFHQNDRGLLCFWFEEDAVIESNGFADATDEKIHVAFRIFGGRTIAMRGCDFDATGRVRMLDFAGNTVDVRQNWWGQNTGPLARQTEILNGALDASDPLTEDPLPEFP